MGSWIDYSDWGQGGALAGDGRLRVLPGVKSPELGNRRHLLVWLPPSYDHSDRDYPVVYMQDGQNLFDAKTSHCGSWEVGAAMDRLAAEEIEAIVVGIPNVGHARLEEYGPFRDRRHGGGKGQSYVRFVAETVKPRVDADFRARTGPGDTALVGSSMGGLISLYGRLARPEVFGLAGALSPSLRFGGDAIFRFARGAARTPGRIYLDVGTREASHVGGVLPGMIRSARYARAVRRMHDLLEESGYRPGEDLLFVEAKDGRHHESAWGERLPGALRFLLAQEPHRQPLGVRDRSG